MTDYTDPLGKWWLENEARFTSRFDPSKCPTIDSLAMLRAYVAETTAERREFREALESELEEALNLAQSRLREMLNECKRRVAAEAELAEARRDSARLLQKYGNHLPRCPKFSFHKTGTFTPECDCGLDAAMAEAQPKEPA